MDYDGFRQMVLGAHLKPIKAGLATEIYKDRCEPGNINPIATYANITDFEIGYNEEVVKNTL